MVVDHSNRKKRKQSGGRKRALKGKRKSSKGNLPTHTTIGEKRSKNKRTKGGNPKVKALSLDYANVLNPMTKKYKKVKILKEVSNAADRNFSRRSILTKGAIIETEAGEAIITSRPSQHGVVNAVLKQK